MFISPNNFLNKGITFIQEVVWIFDHKYGLVCTDFHVIICSMLQITSRMRVSMNQFVRISRNHMFDDPINFLNKGKCVLIFTDSHMKIVRLMHCVWRRLENRGVNTCGISPFQVGNRVQGRKVDYVFTFTTIDMEDICIINSLFNIYLELRTKV